MDHLPSLIAWATTTPSTTTASGGGTISAGPSPLGGCGLFFHGHQIDQPSSTSSLLATVRSDRLLTARAVLSHATAHDPALHTVLASLLIDFPPPQWTSAADISAPVQRRVLVTYLALHRARSASALSSSPWAPYLAHLLDHVRVSTPAATWSEAAVRRLGGTGVPQMVAAKRRALAAEHATWSAAVTSSSIDDATVAADLARVPLEEYMRIDALYWTRVLELPEPNSESRIELAMVPVLDFANHRFPSSSTPVPGEAFVRWERDASGNVEIHVADLSSLSGPTELVLCYGADKPNSDLLFAHGFVVPNNTRGSLPVPWAPEIQMLAESDAALAARIQWAASAGHLPPVLRLRASVVSAPLPPPAPVNGRPDLRAMVQWVRDHAAHPDAVSAAVLIALSDAAASAIMDLGGSSSDGGDNAPGYSDSSTAVIQDELMRALKDDSADPERAGLVAARTLELFAVVLGRVARELAYARLTDQGGSEEEGEEMQVARMYAGQVEAVVRRVLEVVGGSDPDGGDEGEHEGVPGGAADE
ncbi:hypothetical protein BC828DRAFT_376995 [Blastocladiella britannica]|nr:hypothetical protein BC828DRAFT_376995 [Blastocladiella britannica]